LDLYEKVFTFLNIGCSFKFRVKVGVEESSVNVPHVNVQNKNKKKTKSEFIFKQPITLSKQVCDKPTKINIINIVKFESRR
jgi:hypothetical protein